MERAFECELCSDEFESLGKLNAHIQRQDERVGESKKKHFICNMCGYKCSKGRDLIGHMRAHTGERPFKCEVSECGMAFKLKSALKAHIKLKHSDDRPFKCDFPDCRHTAKAAWILKAHKKAHSDERPFACRHSGCNFRAKTKNNLSQHTVNVHSQSRTLACSKCKYSTNVASNLKSHKVVHEGKNENIPCSIEGCEYKGKNRRAAEKHMNRHKTRLPCPVPGCHHYVATKEALKNHMKFHDPSCRAFQCPLCFKHYNTLNELQQHCVVHTNDKPFQCGHCNYEAATRAQVKTHISSVHAAIQFPLIVHLLDDRECLRCEVILPSAEFADHCKGHGKPVLMT